MIRVCDKHGEYEEEEINVFGSIFRTVCPECEKEKEARIQEEKLKQKAQEERADMQKRGIEPEFYPATLGNYIAESESEKKRSKQ